MDRREWLVGSALLGTASYAFPQTLLETTDASQGALGELINLGANENPYGPSPSARKAMAEYAGRTNRYPNKERASLSERIASAHGLPISSVVLGAGSTELLQLLACWCVREKQHLITSQLTFDVLPKYVRRFAGPVSEAPITSKKGIDLTAMETIAKGKPGLVYLVNPNNPTGSKLPFTELKEFCTRVSRHSYIVVDEAYIEYVDNQESMAFLIANNPNIIVLRTFSKIYGLAGLRIGYALADPALAQTLRSYQAWAAANLNVLGIVAANATLGDTAFLMATKIKNAENRTLTLQVLQQLGRNCVTPHANFIWFSCGHTALDISAVYAKKNIRVGTSMVEGERWMRVTIGTHETMKRFVAIAKSIWS